MKTLLALLSIIFLIAVVAIPISCSDDDDDNDDVGGDGDDDDDDDNDDESTLITVSGNAFSFPDYERIVGATIRILESPGTETLTVAEGYFEFIDMPAGMTATFVIDAEGYPETQTKTFTLPETDLEQVTFQVPNFEMYDMLAGLAGIVVDDTKCQMVTTVTVVGLSIYDEGYTHGEAGATVTIVPSIPAEHGPVYFDDAVLPNPALTESSGDGGVLFTNVPVGEYDLYAEKTGVDFISPHLKCRAGVLVNASPPYGLQALE